jgi:hypothetical protein
MKLRISLLSLSAALAVGYTGKAQTAFGENLNVVTTAVPIINVSPDARAGGMGDVGVATSIDGNSIYWNPAKLAFMGKDVSKFAISYTPWLNKLVPDINLAYLSYQKGIGDRQGFGISMRYFSLGDINFRDEQGNPTGTFSPYEFSIDGAYALKFSEQWSGGISLRYIYSDLTQGQVVQGLQTKPGQSVAADIAFYYKSREINMDGGMKGIASFGLNISNIGAKIAYSESGGSDFLPTNLRIGGGYNVQLDEYNKLGLYLDLNKLLVPTPQQITESGDTLGWPTDVNPIQGMGQALNPNAKPGGFNELMREIVWNVGAEWIYNDFFMVRAGYQYEDVTKGNRQYFTFGMGIRYSMFGLDMSYLIPANSTVRSPLENTLRFTLSFDFGAMISAD